jgi:protein-S-isoprenylcysteine O-methyltransferase Ste14
MHLLDQRLLGGMGLLLLAALVVVKRSATGSVLDTPRGNALVQLVNTFNLFFLLIVNPVVAVALVARRVAAIDPTHLTIDAPWAWMVLETIGLAAYVAGFLLMAWALLTLGRNYQLGGRAPRPEDALVTDGPYRLIRHPMYAAALSIALGLACLIQSWALFCVFGVYLVLILALIPMEEEGLRYAYGQRYAAYRQATGSLIPLIY